MYEVRYLQDGVPQRPHLPEDMMMVEQSLLELASADRRMYLNMNQKCPELTKHIHRADTIHEGP